MPKTNPDMVLYWLFALLVVFILTLLIIRFAMFLNDFSMELRNLSNEIALTSGAERRYWIKQRRRLWLSLIPFVKY